MSSCLLVSVKLPKHFKFAQNFALSQRNASKSSQIRTQYVGNYDNFLNVIEKLTNEKKSSIINVLFEARKFGTELSWCGFCNDAETFILEALQQYAPKDSTFLRVDIGDRKEWRDLNNPFRLAPGIRLTQLPTLLRWNTSVRLMGEQCQKEDLLKMFFSPD